MIPIIIIFLKIWLFMIGYILLLVIAYWFILIMEKNEAVAYLDRHGLTHLIFKEKVKRILDNNNY